MSDKLAEFETAYYQKFAKDFVDIYEKEGKQAAGLWTIDNLPKEKQSLSEPFVTQEFLDRGYTFDYSGED